MVLPEEPVQLITSSFQTTSSLGWQVSVVLVDLGHPSVETSCRQPTPGVLTSGGSGRSWTGSLRLSWLPTSRAKSSQPPGLVPPVRGLAWCDTQPCSPGNRSVMCPQSRWRLGADCTLKCRWEQVEIQPSHWVSLRVSRGGRAGVPGLTIGRLLTAGLERCPTGSTLGEAVGRSIGTSLLSRSANEWNELPRLPGLPRPPST